MFTALKRKEGRNHLFSIKTFRLIAIITILASINILFLTKTSQSLFRSNTSCHGAHEPKRIKYHEWQLQVGRQSPISEKVNASSTDSSAPGVQKNSNSQERNREFHNFEGFLSNSHVNPLVEQPFTEEDKRAFAATENVARYLVAAAAALPAKPLVTVIMPCYNRIDTIDYAVTSVLSQSYQNFELILVDDASTDGTLQWCQQKSYSDHRVKVIALHQNSGSSIARNRGLMMANGDYIMYLDSDNRWEPLYMEATVGAFARLPDADAVYSGLMIYSPHFSYEKPYSVLFGSLNKSLLFNRNYVDMNTFSHTRISYNRIGGFDEGLHRFVDWDLTLRYAWEAKVYSVPVLLCHYYMGRAKNTITGNKNLENQLEVVRLRNAAKLVSAEKKSTLLVLQQNQFIASLKHKVTVVIPNFESLTELLEGINSLKKLNLGPLLNIIVVDNNSSAGVIEVLKQKAAEGLITLIQNRKNYGFTYAVNQGILAAAKDSDIVLMNSDAVVLNGALQALQHAAYTLKDVGLVVPQQILCGPTPTIKDHVPYANPDYCCDVNPSYHHKNIINPPLFHDGKVLELNFAPFFFVYLKQDVLAKAGLLDAEFGRHYRSDRLYCDIIRHIHGLKIYHISKAQVLHRLQVSTSALASISKEEHQLMLKKNDWEEASKKELGFRSAAWNY